MTTSPWKPDPVTYAQLQHLIPFVEFLARMPQATRKQKNDANQIVKYIQMIDNPKVEPRWSAGLDIFDFELQERRRPGEGVYRRNWSASFEGTFLEIEAETHHTEEPIGHWGTDFNFNGFVYFEEHLEGQRIYLDQDVRLFTEDAMNYQKYMTPLLKDVEVDISCW